MPSGLPRDSGFRDEEVVADGESNHKGEVGESEEESDLEFEIVD